ncbi:MAG: hypothetical protein WCY80_05710 [Candidatus Izemoplasmatales bacterium]
MDKIILKTTTIYEGVSSCQCGRCYSFKRSESETKGSTVFSSIDKFLNMNLKISYCKKCGYWYDSNARYFNELTFSEKVLYCLGWVIFPGWSALRELTKEGNPFYFGNLAAGLWSFFVVPILLVIGFVVDFVTLSLYFVLNTIAFPISFPYNMAKLIKVQRNYHDEIILLNNAFDYAFKTVSQPKFNSTYSKLANHEYYTDLKTFINIYLNEKIPRKH